MQTYISVDVCFCVFQELLYHAVGFILLLAASLNLLIVVSNYKRSYTYEPYLSAAELLYHAVGFILILAASLNLLIVVSNYKRSYTYEPYLSAA
ncbi:hypothetical protein J437_LFUL011461, partial [Ladona fulva]